MTRQHQNIEEGAEGHQAARDITIHKGLNADQMAEIMVALAGQLHGYFAQAETTAQKRFSELREALLEEFAHSKTRGRPEAFADPDYQFVVRSAHQTFARSGDKTLKAELVRLLVERSVQPSRNRIALLLNEAISIAGNLTAEEYAALAVVLIFKFSKVSTSSFDIMTATLDRMAQPFVENLPDSNHSYEYLAAMRCISINTVTRVDFWSRFRNEYSTVFTSGFSEEELNGIVRDDAQEAFPSSLVTRMSGEEKGLVRFTIGDEQKLRTEAKMIGYTDSTVNKLIDLHNRTLWNVSEVKEQITRRIPVVTRIADLWGSTYLGYTDLTALGKTLAHAALVGAADLDSPLETWIQ